MSIKKEKDNNTSPKESPKLKIAIQGVAGAFHDEAARKFFGDNIELVECNTFRLLCEQVDNDVANYGIMAIENTIAGSLLQNFAYFDTYRLHIIGEVYLRIRMNLMALPGTKMKDLKYVSSHPIALRQCNDFLATLSPEIKVTESDDTAESAKIIAAEQLKHTAAIAGVAAAKMYGLELLKEGIETEKKNYTRFVVLSKTAKTNRNSNKASLSFEIRHQAGSLAETLAIFARNGINLTKIQSVPILGKPYQYSFHVDVEWKDTVAYNKALTEVVREVAGLSVYGEYVKGEIPV